MFSRDSGYIERKLNKVTGSEILEIWIVSVIQNLASIDDQSVIRSVCPSVSQSVSSQSINLGSVIVFSKAISQPVSLGQSVSQPVSQSVSQSVSQPVSQSVSQSVSSQ